MDTALFKLINDSMRCPLLDQLMPVLSDKDFVVLPGLMALIVLFYFGGRYVRTCMLVLLIGLALSDTGSEKVIKNLVQQNRLMAMWSWCICTEMANGPNTSQYGMPTTRAGVSAFLPRMLRTWP